MQKYPLFFFLSYSLSLPRQHFKIFHPSLSLSDICPLYSLYLLSSPLLSSSESTWAAAGGDVDEEAGRWVRRRADGEGAMAGGYMASATVADLPPSSAVVSWRRWAADLAALSSGGGGG